MARRLLIAGNWKMNHDAASAAGTAAELDELCSEVDVLDMLLCPPFTSLAAVAETLEDSPIAVGAQNVHWENSGAFTGEISAEMLSEIPVDYVIIGHSERRQYFGETDETVNKRLKAALAGGLKPIVCVGEVLAQREAGDTERVVGGQLRAGLSGISEAQLGTVVIAYEPVWAIGTGVTATPEQAQEVHAFIRGLIAELYGANAAEQLRIQYGGSVKADNVEELMSQPDIDGALVGGASVMAEDFAELIHNAAKLA